MAQCEGDPFFKNKANQNFTDEGNFFSSPYVQDDLPPAAIACSGNLSFSGSAGIYEAVVELGTNTGDVTVTFVAFNVPDRFVIIWDNQVVADSLFVGNALSIHASATLGNKTLNKYLLNTNQTFDQVGTENIVIDNSDLASLDPEDLRSAGSHGNQIGVVANHPSASSPANDGSVKLSFNKSTSFPTKAVIKIIGVDEGTAWDLLNIQCPT